MGDVSWRTLPLTCVLALAACSHPLPSPPSASPTTTTASTPRIGWIDQPLLPGTRLALARTIPTSIRSAPPCRGNQLGLRPNSNPGAGTDYAELYITNTSTTACTVSGRPLVELVSPDGRVVSRTANPSLSGPGLVLVTGSSALLRLGGIGNDVEPQPCPTVSRMVLDLGPSGTATVASDPLRCSQVASLEEDTIEAIQGVEYANQVVQVVLRGPATAQAGAWYDYLALVRLTSASSLGPDFFPLCPIYRQRVSDATIRRDSFYELNCTPLAGVRNQPWVVFGMRVLIPPALSPGSRARLTWTAAEPAGASGTTTITITR